jgi:hypothetical protein
MTVSVAGRVLTLAASIPRRRRGRLMPVSVAGRVLTPGGVDSAP